MLRVKTRMRIKSFSNVMETDSETTHHSFKLDSYEGPLDLLLFLIKKNEINIYDIPISQITEQYLSYLRYLSVVNLDNLSEFHLMATTLLYIKSKMLLPRFDDLDDDFEDPRKELVDRLIEYKKFKKLSELIAEKEKESECRCNNQSAQSRLPGPLRKGCSG